MALVVKDRVKETTTSTGTGTINLAGAAGGFQSFVAGVGNGNTTFYAIEDANGTAWEVGIGTVTDASPDTLARTTVLANSNGDTDAITLSTGTHTVFGTYPAGKSVYIDASGNLSHTVDISSDTNLVAGAGITLTGDTLSADMTQEAVEDYVNGLLTAGANIGLTYDDAAGTLTIAATDNNTTYTAGDGLDLSGTAFALDLKANGGAVIESGELAIDLAASSITGTLAVGDGGTGATTLNNLITLGTHTTGNYVATIADSGDSTITVANSGSESAAVTLDIADDAIDTVHIADLQVTTAKIAADAITGAKIADDAVDSEHYVDGSIDTAHIGDLQVTTAKIANDAVTYAKMQHTTTANRVLGAASAGAIGEVQVSNDMLANSTVSYGGIELALGASDATPAFALDDATGLPIVAGTTGTLTVARGGTGVTSLSNGQLLIGGSSGATASTLTAGSNVTITNADGGITIAAAAKLTTEEVQDIVGAMVTGNTESGITVAYEDGDGTLDFTVTLDFNDLSDMASGAPADKDILVYSSSEWKHVACAGTASGDINFSWSEIGTDGVISITNTEYSGIVPVNKGGTGANSLTDVRTWLFGGSTLPESLGGSGSTSFPGNNSVTLGTHTVGDYVATIVPGTGISSSGSSNGEGTAHEIAIDTNWAGQSNITTIGTITTGTWEGTTIAVNQGGTGVTSLSDITSANNLLTVGGGAGRIIGGDATLTVNEANFDLDNIGGVLGLTDQVTGTLPIANGGTGATTLNNLITLGDHTTGNYVATVAADGSTITVANSGSETAAVTVKVADGGIDSDQIAAGAVDLAHLSATGTKSSSTYLRGDTTWATVSGGSGDMTGVDLTASTGIDITSETNTTSGDYSATIAVDVSDFMTNGSDNRILTATGTDAMNAEANFSFTGSAATLIGTLTVGVDDTGHDVKLFGATSGAYMLWDESLDRLELKNSSFVQSIANAEEEPENDATLDIHLNKGNYFDVELNANITDIDFKYGAIGQRFMIRFEQDASSGPYTIAWDAVTMDFDGGGSAVAVTISWPGGTAPTMTATDDKADTYGFVVRAEGHMDGFIIGQNMPVNDN